jgi:hypothetical protein
LDTFTTQRTAGAFQDKDETTEQKKVKDTPSHPWTHLFVKLILPVSFLDQVKTNHKAQKRLNIPLQYPIQHAVNKTNEDRITLDSNNKRRFLHSGIICDLCEGSIQGERYSLTLFYCCSNLQPIFFIAHASDIYAYIVMTLIVALPAKQNIFNNSASKNSTI